MKTRNKLTRCETSIFKINEFLETENNDVWGVDAVQNVFQKVDVLGGSGERLGFLGIDVPRTDEDINVPECTELDFSLLYLTLCMHVRLRGGWSAICGHHSPIQSVPSSPSQKCICSSRPRLMTCIRSLYSQTCPISL
jgi:hypothetical protein